ncbi:MAG TPA: hypothetical protein VH640_27680 [Bryobacteraceae bacterium]|jgi:prefoldin subunit 5
MTIDERLERLAERHEALTESVELLTHDIRELRASVADLTAIAEASLRNINALAGIAENHERRITRLEGGE